ncbi:MAG: 2,3-bisphosphoglycerate-independent phosphoglycerate mutase [Alphaproteobacteria bacterium]|nr:2,3-bisphosphoglycerate-independent phosphoglycerate mutase [Alphaproteobacteria bacterium]
MSKPLVLCIMDGVGISRARRHNAVALADMPFFDSLLAKYPHSRLKASGTAVGLPAGIMGNSEVGHITIGAGRVVNQFLRRFELEDFDNNKNLNHFISVVKKKDGIVHVAGLMSDGDVHSDLMEIITIVRRIIDAGLRVCIHFIADGRDTPPKSAQQYVRVIKTTLSREFKCGNVFWGTVSGRYYTMDRNKNMDRTELAYNAIARARAKYHATTIDAAIKDAYGRGETDEFIKPTIIDGDVAIRKKDGFIFGNYRSDRARQIVRAMLDTGCEMLCFSQYGEGLNEHCPALIEDMAVPNTLGDVLAQNGLSQLRIAETEKYNHVTYFMDAERNIDFPHGKKILVPSPDVATFDLKPEMSAPQITDKLIPELSKYDVVILNYANGDMVGHTGVESATVRAMECLDAQLARLVPAVLKLGGELLITADHGNAEQMWDTAHNVPCTSHTTNPVNLIYVSKNAKPLRDGGLKDIAPTMLKILGISQPSDMKGKALF